MRSRNPMIKLLAVTVFAGVISAAPAYAAPNSISTFVTCLNGLPAGSTVADAVQCVPSTGCYATVTLSPESGQPACTLSDGTRLPRVIFSCTGPASTKTPALRFRPSFTLCTQPSNLINHIEVGEDVKRDPTDDFVANVQKMADIDSAGGFNVTEFGLGALAIDDTPVNSKGCAECHDRKGTVGSQMTTANLFGAIIPAVGDGIIYTTDPDPNIQLQHPVNTTPLSVICSTDIPNSTKLKNKALAQKLCNALATKTP